MVALDLEVVEEGKQKSSPNPFFLEFRAWRRQDTRVAGEDTGGHILGGFQSCGQQLIMVPGRVKGQPP